MNLWIDGDNESIISKERAYGHEKRLTWQEMAGQSIMISRGAGEQGWRLGDLGEAAPCIGSRASPLFEPQPQPPT